MIPHNPNLPTIDPRLLVDSDGPAALADLLAQTGYVIQRRMLIDLKHVLRSGKPWLIEGPRGGGKTALGEALAQACNLPCFYLQGMQGLTLDDVLYTWDREGQNQWVRQATSSGKSLSIARAEQWSREYLVLGEALGAVDLPARCHTTPVWLFLSNDTRHDLSPPLRSRCLYSWLEPPTPREEVRILRARVPAASPQLLGNVVKIINCIRGIGGVTDKPGLRESIDLLTALSNDESITWSTELLEEHLCFLGKRVRDRSNLEKGVARLLQAIRSPHPDIDRWVESACAESISILEETA